MSGKGILVSTAICWCFLYYDIERQSITKGTIVELLYFGIECRFVLKKLKNVRASMAFCATSVYFV
jgi:hypothetical protein